MRQLGSGGRILRGGCCSGSLEVWCEMADALVHHVLSFSTMVIVLCSPFGPGVSANEMLPRDADTGRWYTAAEQAQGRDLYATHCAMCHGDRGQGQPNWEKRDESGYFPAPPLDGSGHSANHPLGQMLHILDTGGGSMGGWMPSFVDVLSDNDKRAVLAWIQSLWPAATYEAWTASIGELVEEE